MIVANITNVSAKCECNMVERMLIVLKQKGVGLLAGMFIIIHLKQERARASRTFQPPPTEGKLVRYKRFKFYFIIRTLNIYLQRAVRLDGK